MKRWTEEERYTRNNRSKRLGLSPTGRWKGQEWTAEMVDLLGTIPDVEAAGRKRRSGHAEPH
ncbi:MAG TPA: hypothetical protein VH092_12615 [Urbifossiella sp.]|nr:hypothetical protein [Urbifossiella sp.]